LVQLVGEHATMDKKSNALLRHLSEMPAAVIYALADKVHLFNGFELCKRSPVALLNWSDDGGTLTVELCDTAVFEVSLRLVGGELSSSCDCGVWSPRGRCPHLVAALATVKKALSPASFPMLQLPAKYLGDIRSQLLSVSPESISNASSASATVEGRYSLVVDRVAGKVRMRLLQDRMPVTPFEPGLSPAVREFLKIMYAPAMRGRCVEEFLSRFGGKFPVLYAAPDLSPDAPLPLRYHAGGRRSVFLRLDLRHDELLVTRTLEDGSRLDEKSFVAEGYHFDLLRERIERVDDTAAERFGSRLLYRFEQTPEAQLVQDADGFRIAAAAFNPLQIAFSDAEFPVFLGRTNLCVEGVKREPRQVRPNYRLNILELGDRVRLVGEGVADGLAFSLSEETFWFFSAEGRTRFPQPLKAKKRVLTILKTCFATLAVKTRGERDKIVRLALNSPDFCKRGVRAEARNIITSFWQTAIEPRTQLLFSAGEWLGVAVEGERQASLLGIPSALFGCEIFSEAGTPGEMVVDRKTFMKSLTRLRGFCADLGFSLAVGGEELETVAWSFTLDATRSSIDWFEVRPEIRCDGELVDESEFLEAVSGGGVFRRGNSMVILDEQSSSALSLFATNGKREVVRVPRLQILDWIALRRGGVRVLLSPEDEQIIDSLTHFDTIPKRTVPTELKATLRNYQCDGYNWLAFLYEHRFGACLADDMGLGKTIQAIALLAGLKEGLIHTEVPACVPHLVVVPPTLIFNWESELSRFYPSLKVGVYRGQGRRAEFSGLDIVLTSYGMIQRDIELLGTLVFHVIVFDEAQAVKNIHAETTGAVRRLKGRFKLTLTGTPVENHLGEYFSVMDLALPGLLGPYEQFRKQMGREGSGFVETLIRRTHPFILRRAKDMIAAELPAKVETDIYLEMSPRQKALYVRTVAQVKSTVAEAYSSNAPGQARIIALTAILKLRQICLSSRLILSESADRSPKVDFLVDQLQELFTEGHSVLVFSQFTSFLDIVQEGLSQHGIPFFRLDGSTPVGARKNLVERFQESAEPSVFLLSLKAGGRGLNLTRASYVFHLDPWWNPAVENQASDRAHRIGQKSQVTITRLLMRHSIEEKMMELKKRKLKLYRSLLEDSELEGAGSIGREDFEFLLG
jgi:hypothetical protein